MLTCYQSYRVVKENGRYADIIRELDDLYEALDVVKDLYRANRGNHYTVECWDNFYDDYECVYCEFSYTVWDSSIIPPWEDV